MTRPSIGRDLLDVPMGDMIRDMAFAIADAQMHLDSNSVEVAQMMGGLKTITQTINGEERVTFEDSRVFFGKERFSLSDALEIYNTTSDAALKASIKAIAITGNTNVEEDVYTTPGDPDLGLGTAPAARTDKYYKDATTYYKYDGVGPDFYAAVSGTPSDLTYRIKATGTNTIVYIPSRVSMLELGFTPTFYQFVDTIIEVKISIRFTEETNSNTSSSASTRSGGLSFRLGFGRAGVRRQVSTSQVNASYSQKFNYSAEGSSLLRTKLTPIPPPAILEERIRQQMEIAREQA
jgi:hypothetical protein